LIEKWSGNKAWARVSYPITTGNHLLSWVYSKDNYGVSGSDCAWVDFIALPAIYTTIVGTTELTKENAMQLSIFPNPATEQLNILYKLATDSEVDLKIYSSNGQIVYSNENDYHTAGSYSVNFNASSLSRGIYFISLKTINQVITQKLIITK
jgi:hypothetical protein